MTYAEKLKDPRWQRKRLDILNRDDFTCRICNDTKSTLHVHHEKYFKNTEPWDYHDDNFKTLCNTCHEILHSNPTKVEILLISILLSNQTTIESKNKNIKHTIKDVMLKLLKKRNNG